MLLVILLIILAIVTGALGFILKGLFWLVIIGVLLLVAAFVVGRANSRR